MPVKWQRKNFKSLPHKDLRQIRRLYLARGVIARHRVVGYSLAFFPFLAANRRRPLSVLGALGSFGLELYGVVALTPLRSRP